MTKDQPTLTPADRADFAEAARLIEEGKRLRRRVQARVRKRLQRRREAKK
jgi:hypothetical protein